MKLIRSLLLLVIVLFSVVSCNNQKETIPASEYAAYINAYTGGVISQKSTIRVVLAQEQPVVELEKEIKNNPFTFSPSLKGKSYWVDNKTIEFVPEENALKPGQEYNATFKLGDFVKLDKAMNNFMFSFRVLERTFSVDMETVETSTQNPEQVTVKGTIRFSDIVDGALVNKMITVRLEKTSLPFVVEADEKGTTYRFTVNDIPKKEEDVMLDIVVEGKPIGIDREVKKTVLIPAKDYFKVLSANLIREPENGIQVVFSEPVSNKQDLTGLLSLTGVSSFTTEVSGNKVNVYFDHGKQQDVTVLVNENIKSTKGDKLKETSSLEVVLEILKPQVELLSAGTIVPNSKKLEIPFRAVSLHAVDLKIVRIYESNILMFLQTNELSSSNELRRAGRLVYEKTIVLNGDVSGNLNKWNDYSIDISRLMEQDPGAIYQLVFSFKQEYSAYPCEAQEGVKQFSDASELLTELNTEEDREAKEAAWDIPNAYYSMNDPIDWNLYEWSERDNPCHPTYYMNSERKAFCNVMSSNLGVIVKQNQSNKLWISVSDILTTEPQQHADVTVYNYQLQPIGFGKTDKDGFLVLEVKNKPFIVVASLNNQKTYLKVQEGLENSLSRFDVGGKTIEKGLKGFIYGERGVWRPGDTLHVSFVLQGQDKKIPESHPVAFEMYNPRGQFYNKYISTRSVNGFYTFKIPTLPDDPTGLWNGYVKVGGATFHKSFRIETIKPNRLKIDLNIPGSYINAKDGEVKASIASSWLTGLPAANLQAKVEIALSKTNTSFANYSNYIFNNPATQFSTSKTEVFDGVLNNEGNVNFTMRIPAANDAPGLLRANITTRVFEQGGDASINTTTMPFSPFTSYVGLNLHQTKDKYFETDKDHLFDVVTVNADGKLVDRTDLEYMIYRVNWSWWWENKEESFYSYINNTSVIPVATGKLSTVKGKAQFKFRINYPEWGRYLVYVKDSKSGHATGGTIYMDWPEWRGRSDKKDPSGISMLSFSVDKESYELGETVNVIVPAAAKGRALIALENGSAVIHREWIQISEQGDTKYQFKITPEMAPNVYVHISLLQPHAQTVNELPIRMYGVVPVFVTNKETILEPQINMPDVLRPEKEFTVTVSEKRSKAMTYTLAIVDDGLLDLTNYKTPDVWEAFYSREALGIRTWDMFDQVIGAFSGSFSNLYSVGGDEMLKGADANANRFRPVVKVLGPFTLESGKTNSHKVTLPMYVGSVRTMIVAGQNGAYGKTEKTTPVRTPLMVLSTLPRVISVGEEIQLPVNLFSMEEGIKDVTATVETSSNIQLVGDKKRAVTFTKVGDQMLYFKLKTGNEVGAATVKINAAANGHTATETIEIEVRNPNPSITQHVNKLLAVNESADFNYQFNGSAQNSWVKLEVSRIPSVDISRRFDYLYNYEHNCTEQLTSKALPLLFVSLFKEVDNTESNTLKKNVNTAIKNLYSRQLSNGGFVYWPGNSVADEWITSYAGVFLTLAREKGYEVNANVLNLWRNYQRNAVSNWTGADKSSGYYSRQSDMQQTYRLYSLALGGVPELGAMNRMKEMKDISIQAKWQLAAAYAVNGKMNAANELVFNAQTTVTPYSANNYVYGSSNRDESIILEALVLLNREQEAFKLAQKLSKELSKESYFSTQSTAFALMAMGRLAEKMSGTIEMDWVLNGKKQSVNTAKAVYQTTLPSKPQLGTVQVKNRGKGSLFVDLVTKTQLLKDTLPAISNNLRVEASYSDMNGNTLSVLNIKQGTDFQVKVKVSNISGTTGYKDLALTHIIPSGWEIYNERMITPDEEDTDASYTYRDIRDDRVFTYFNLGRGESKTFVIRLQASYAGTFVLPAIFCEAMYDTDVQAKTKAGYVTVER